MRVRRLSTTPVKGLLQAHPDAIELTTDGVRGDRLLHLVDETGRLQSCTANPGLYGLAAHLDGDVLTLERDGEVLLSGPVLAGEPVETDLWGMRLVRGGVVRDPAWSALLSELVGRSVRLVRTEVPGYDVEPVTLVGSGSIEALSQQAGAEVDARRFRMLVEVDGVEPHAEDGWAGRLLRLGSALVRMGGPVQRCAATTRHPDTGRVDLQTLRLITGYRGRQDSVFGMGANFGVYGAVVEPGRIAVGDAVVLAGSGEASGEA